MCDAERQVKAHYGNFARRESLFAALKKRGLAQKGVTPKQLAAFDQFHTGGADATSRLINVLAVEPGDHVLDLGCGLGGPARMLAHKAGCKVTGLDISPHFIDVANELTDLTAQSDQVDFIEGSAVSLPFGEKEIDGAWQLHVGMNVPDKEAMYAEVFRVLKPGATFIVHDPVRGSLGNVVYPVPWATEASTSYLISSESMTSSLKATGFQIADVLDETDEGLMWFENLDRARGREAQSESDDGERSTKPIDVMTKNHRSNLASGAVKIMTVVARKPA